MVVRARDINASIRNRNRRTKGIAEFCTDQRAVTPRRRYYQVAATHLSH